MDEKQEKYLYFGAIACGFIIIFLACWYLLSDVHGDGGRAVDVGATLERVGGEQQRTIDNIERIERGLDDSAGRVDSIEGRITDAESAITDAYDRGTSGAAIVADSAERIRRCRAIIESIRSRTR